ncbi:uncharacterized protein LOC130789015 isoform X2 [Actinidia eriantha]|uniref:uncharacterized protein LOC130789015 isoform X2 n=1 Tax=Actinidia eriantha TaxID=165200 RepID=UPI0025830310|nr:uncharacterized protein LOC130789015 isoform X2 [Actinidia eriantha]
MEAEGFFYTALSHLSAATAPPPPPADSEPYVVFRNEISLSTIQPHSPETTAADYFSLDVDADNEEAPADLISTPLASASVIERDRTLEGGWFRANCWFKSPLLQLHKVVEGEGGRSRLPCLASRSGNSGSKPLP